MIGRTRRRERLLWMPLALSPKARSMMFDDYTKYFVVEAAGQRIGLCICRRCGATILLGDKDVDASALHDRWHAGEPEERE